jgi:hypothetical protein
VSTADSRRGGTVGARCHADPVNQSAESSTTADIQSITAAALRVGDELLDGSTLRPVTSIRLQGAPPEACIELAGLTGRRHVAAAARVQVHCRHQAAS